MRPRLRHLPYAWAVLLVLVLLGPALGVGYVLSYDLVWVPRLAVRPDFLGGGSALPRAVPSDLVVAVLDTVVPAMLLQKVVLAGPLLAAAAGMVRLVGPSLVARLVVVTLAIWNPFTVERLHLGHWTVLVGYGVLPWLVLAGIRWRAEGRMPRSLLALLPLGCLSANAGLVSAVVLLVVGGGFRDRTGLVRSLRLAALVLAANAPWIVAGVLHGAEARATVTGPFALRGEGSLPAPLTALSLGGVWNQEVVPASRETFLAWLALGLVLLLAAAGVRVWVRRNRSAAVRLVTLWAVGLVLACATWLVPGAVAWLSQHVPGGGVLRDGSRWLVLCLPVWTAVPATGAEVLGRALGAHDRVVRAGVAGLCALAPVALLYDAAWGLAGELQPVRYPVSWSQARQAVGDDGTVLLLPFSAYRAPAWNGGRTVLDPLGRYLRPDYLMSDRLLVGDRLLAGEDPRAEAAAAALDRSDPAARAAALRRLGVRYVATELDAP